jgi:hypothetical protein
MLVFLNGQLLNPTEYKIVTLSTEPPEIKIDYGLRGRKPTNPARPDIVALVHGSEARYFVVGHDTTVNEVVPLEEVKTAL